jgi:hypothetical protein
MSTQSRSQRARWPLFFLFSSLAAFGGVIAACSNGGGNAASPGGDNADPGSFCNTYCARVHECDEDVDKDTCDNACANANAARLPKLRADVVTGIEWCLEEKDCKAVLARDVIGACQSEQVAMTSPSGAAQEFCSSLESSFDKCGADFGKGECLDSFKVYSDHTLATAKACTTKSCPDIAPCVLAAIGGRYTSDGGVTVSSVDTRGAFASMTALPFSFAGRTWEALADRTAVTYAEAERQCASHGSRLPTRQELSALVKYGPTLDDDGAYYWTAAPGDTASTGTLTGAQRSQLKTATARVRCTR